MALSRNQEPDNGSIRTLPSSLPCKVLVVDDMEEEAVKIGLQLIALNNSPAIRSTGVQLEVELTTSATWSIKAIDDEPFRWQVVISDVMMPPQDDAYANQEARGGFTIWKRLSPSGAASFAHGGFPKLAESLSKLRLNRPQASWPKFVLTSSFLRGHERSWVDAFSRRHRDWFKYLDKYDCSKHWPDPTLYLFALLNAFSRHREPTWSDGLFDTAIGEWTRLGAQARAFAGNTEQRHVLVLGPSGSGKSTLATHLFASRGLKEPTKVHAGHLDKNGLSPHWRNSSAGLYLWALELMDPSAYPSVMIELDQNRENRNGENNLCVWFAESLELLRQARILPEGLIGQLEGLPNRFTILEPTSEDLILHAQAIKDRKNPILKVEDGLYEELSRIKRPNNLSGLSDAIDSAIIRASTLGDSILRKEHFTELQIQPSRGSQRLDAPQANLVAAADKKVAGAPEAWLEEPAMAEPHPATFSEKEFQRIMAAWGDLKLISRQPRLLTREEAIATYPSLKGAVGPRLLDALEAAHNRLTTEISYKDHATRLFTEYMSYQNYSNAKRNGERNKAEAAGLVFDNARKKASR
jgi:energy-coupling factor transporter ATP-binding protein EcfA2